MRKLRFIVIGSGWRSLFYWRIAKAYPSLFEMAAMLVRTKEKADRMRTEYGIHTVMTEQECEELRPEFVVVAVNKMSIAEVAAKWAGKGIPVLLETPAGMTEDELKMLWKLKQGGARIQAAEQYALYPTHAAAIAVVKKGYLKDPYAVDLSTAHDYHAASLIRAYLGLGLEPVTIEGKEYCFPVEETDSRYGTVKDGTVSERRRVRLDFTYHCQYNKKKYAFYDFDGVQYHSGIRTRRVNVKGQTGELDNLVLRYVDRAHELHEQELKPEMEHGGVRRILLGDEVVYENPFAGLSQQILLPEDETAVGTMMLGMRDLIETGRELYPLAYALEDAYIRILMEQAVAGGNPVTSGRMPWTDAPPSGKH